MPGYVRLRSEKLIIEEIVSQFHFNLRVLWSLFLQLRRLDFKAL